MTTKRISFALTQIDNWSKIILNKVDTILSKIIEQFRKILEKDPNFTGNVNVSLCLGGLTGIEKKENLKIK